MPPPPSRTDPSATRARSLPRAGLPWLLAALLLLAAASCASSPATQGDVAVGEDLTAGQQVLNVVSFPFRMLGYAVYYPLKFLFYDIWVWLYDALFGAGDDDVSVLVRALDDPDAERRAGAAVALASVGGEEAARALLPLVADPDPGARAAAVWALGRMGRGFVEPDLRRVLETHADTGVRAAAARILGRLRDGPSFDLLAAALRDASWTLRQEAAGALGTLGDARATPLLGQALSDEDPRVRGTAAGALGALGDPAAVGLLRPLFDALAREGTFVRAQVIVALARLNAPDLEAPVLAIAEGTGPVADPHSRAAALWALGRLGVKDAVPLLTRVLQEGREPLKILEHAAVALALLGEKEALVNGARSDEVLVRAAAVSGLLELGGDDAVDPLCALAKDPYTDVRQRAILSLLTLGFRDAVIFLVEQLPSPDPEIRAFAFLELKRISGRDLGLDPGPWLTWWQENGKTWDLRRFYPELEEEP